MLAEVRHVRQVPGDPFRRWFVDDQLDIFVWYEPDGRIFGFQLCCDLPEASLVTTWTQARGFSHATLDDGDDKPTVNRSPLLWPTPPRNVGLIRRSFSAASGGLPATERTFVCAKLAELDRAN